MKIVLIAVSTLGLAACSAPKVNGFDKVEYIQRQEIVHASK